jgi:XTP/dITP diphosphohydrolase
MVFKLKKLVIASNNPGKLREIAQILAPLGIEVVPQSDFGVSEAEEPHCTFIENALAKARHASRHTGLPALADDSGICVTALGGEPGVHSARFASVSPAGSLHTRESQDQRNNEKLIGLLSTESDRSAHYYCVIALVHRAEDPQPLIADAEWRGQILPKPRGSGGFGYDPYFYLPDYGRTAAELSSEEKNAISHRGQALVKLVARLREDSRFGKQA